MEHGILQFEDFELDLVRYELRRAGRRVKLQPVPTELLILLVERRGALVRREDILSRLWATDTQADVERSINTAIRKVRLALGDDAERPRFIETVIGKGYRFIPTVSGELAEAVPPEADSPPITATAQKSTWPARFAVVAVCVIAIALASLRLDSLPGKVEPVKIRPLTAQPGTESGPVFSPDGKQVAFAWTGEDRASQHIYIKPAGTGSPVPLTAAQERDSDPSWSPDGRFLSFLRQEAQQSLAVYVTPSSGVKERRLTGLARANHFRPAWTADGTGLVIMDSESPSAPPSIFLLSIESCQKRRLTTAGTTSTGDWAPTFSPDGRTLAFMRNMGSTQNTVLVTLPVDRNGTAKGPERKVNTGRTDFVGCDWTPDGRSLICATHSEMVRIPVSGGPAESLPFRDALQPAVSRQGNRLAYVRSVRDTDIFRLPGPGAAGEVTRLISSTRLDGAPSYSPAGDRIAFGSVRSGSEHLWVADGEGQRVVQLTSFAGGDVGSPRWSPDGKRIAFDSTESGSSNVFLIGVEGGNARQLTSGGSSNVRPSWSRDGRWVYFGSNRTGSWEVWKTASEGGHGVQVTKTGAREAFENPDGTFLYYSKGGPEKGIWRIPVNGGSEEHVTGDGLQGSWALGVRGIYYLRDPGVVELQEYSGKRVVIPTHGLRPGTGAGGLLAVGPGDRWILFTALVRSDNEITLVENFQ